MMRCLGRVATILVLLSCREVNTNLVNDPDAAIDGGPAGAGGSGGADGAAGEPDAAAPVDAARPDGGTRCGARLCPCDDGIDNDADGLVDGFDAECTGPRDQDEGSFATGGPNPPTFCRDCFWDENAGGGGGDCRYPTGCFLDPSFPGGPNCPSCVPSETCIDTCLARTPNGCDCFGCCEVTRDDGTMVEIVLEASCSLDNLDDVLACPRCTRNPDCSNPCSACELCPGRKPSDLPASCRTGQGVGHTCNPGLQTCSESIPCQGTDYCQQGCCLLTVF